MEQPLFHLKKTYKLSFDNGYTKLFFTGTQVELKDSFITFIDKFGKQQVIPSNFLRQADEVKT